jgi:hypothetical protein
MDPWPVKTRSARTMADRDQSAQELLLDVKVAEASRLYKFYLNQEKRSSAAWPSEFS